MNKKSVFVLSAVSWATLSYAEDEALDKPDAASFIVEADPSGAVKTPSPSSAEDPSTVDSSVDAEEEPSLDESEDSVPSGEDFFVVEPPSDMSAPDAPETPEVPLSSAAVKP